MDLREKWLWRQKKGASGKKKTWNVYWNDYLSKMTKTDKKSKRQVLNNTFFVLFYCQAERATKTWHDLALIKLFFNILFTEMT